MFGWLLGLKIEGIGLLVGVGTRMGSIGKLVHDVITMPLSRLVPVHTHRRPVELVSFAITGAGMHVMLVVGINDDNNFLYKIVKITVFFLSISFLCYSTAGCTIYKLFTCITITARKERNRKSESNLINRFNKLMQYGGHSLVVIHFSSLRC